MITTLKEAKIVASRHKGLFKSKVIAVFPDGNIVNGDESVLSTLTGTYYLVKGTMPEKLKKIKEKNDSI